MSVFYLICFKFVAFCVVLIYDKKYFILKDSSLYKKVYCFGLSERVYSIFFFPLGMSISM